MDETGKVYPQVKKVNIEWLPIKLIDDIKPFSELVEEIQKMKVALIAESTRFSNFVSSRLSISLNRKLSSWSALDFNDFINEVNKCLSAKGKPKLTKADELDWLDIFEEKREIVKAILQKINEIDEVIDMLVYEIYHLTDEEIAVVENA